MATSDIQKMVSGVMGQKQFTIGGTDGTPIGNVADRLKVDSASSVSPIPASSVIYKIARLLDGSTSNMNVNGSSVNKNYEWSPGSGEIWYVEAVRIFLQDNGSAVSTDFGAISGGLSNGVQILIRSGGTEYEIGNMKTNIDMSGLFWGDAMSGASSSDLFGSADVYIGEIKFSVPIPISNSSSDYIRVKIRDNLTGIDQFHAKARAWRTI